MTVQTDLEATLHLFIQQEFKGLLEEISANKLPLQNLLEIQQSLSIIPAFVLSPINLGTVNADVIKASAGAVYSIKVTNKHSTVRYFQIVDKATTPTASDSALIVDVIAIPANETIIVTSAYFGATGLVCNNGISWAFSSTDTTITLATSSHLLSTVGYL